MYNSVWISSIWQNHNISIIRVITIFIFLKPKRTRKIYQKNHLPAAIYFSLRGHWKPVEIAWKPWKIASKFLAYISPVNTFDFNSFLFNLLPDTFITPEYRVPIRSRRIIDWIVFWKVFNSFFGRIFWHFWKYTFVQMFWKIFWKIFWKRFWYSWRKRVYWK